MPAVFSRLDSHIRDAIKAAKILQKARDDVFKARGYQSAPTRTKIRTEFSQRNDVVLTVSQAKKTVLICLPAQDICENIALGNRLSFPSEASCGIDSAAQMGNQTAGQCGGTRSINSSALGHKD
ncbi:hypothetical protein B0H10DRAFT_1942194 [Mycena sp. CBHHK59/15]|nr:hypothetical protein B0H10DRAFT_1942194 [Mycena sp. CBHHK59/15]